MDANTLRLLEYHKILEELKSFCTFSLGRELVEQLRPVTEESSIRSLQQEVTQAVQILKEEGRPPFGGLRDIHLYLKRAVHGSILKGEAFLAIYSTIMASWNLYTFFSEIEERREDYLSLLQLVDTLHPPKDLAFEIDKKIDEYGELRDDASSTLKSIRSKMMALESRVKSHLEGMLSSPRYTTFLQDRLITMRNERYVLPVKGQYRKNVPGIVHDRSASGQTVFIEPKAVVEMNNQIKELLLKEEEEMNRLFMELTERVSFYASDLKKDLETTARLDFIFAKGAYSKKISGVEPILGGESIIIKEGYHPLLTGEVVPIHIHLGEDFKTLVITGPNTGGKTVTLKTVGLFALMAQSGLHIPAKEGTSLPLFHQIFSDIGDEQSIEQSLSTFSSHMRQIVKIIDNTKAPALVLLDELGAGTDPREGAALAISLLHHFIQQGIHTIATTHYSELKTFAYSTKGVENASMEFDVESLSPTFKVIMGLPGKSNAFEIASRLGLQDMIIEQAREHLTRDELQVESMMERLKTKGSDLDEKEYQLYIEKVQLEKKIEEYNHRLNQLERRERETLKKAHEEAKELLGETRQTMKDLLRKIKEEKGRVGDRLEGEINKELKEKRETIEEGLSSLQEKEEYSPLTHVSIGQEVYIHSLKCTGRVLEVLNDEEGVIVQAGNMRVQTSPTELHQVAGSNDRDSSSPISMVKRSKRETISTRLDLRGLRAHEALTKTDKYLDDAYLAGLKEVEIIHGKGKGALREVITDLLEGHYHILSHRPGGPREGGSGVTLARLKD